MDAPLLVVVTGPPASGKTTIAEAVARDLSLPLVSKDAVKETLFERLGTGDRDWSRRLGRATFALMFAWLTGELLAGRSAVVEANFDAAANADFLALPPHRTLQIYCTAPAETLLQRYAARSRHPGHLDEEVLAELRAGTHEGRWAPLALGGELIEVDSASSRALEVVERVRITARR